MPSLLSEQELKSWCARVVWELCGRRPSRGSGAGREESRASQDLSPSWHITRILSLSGRTITLLARKGLAGHPVEEATCGLAQLRHFIGVIHGPLCESDAQSDFSFFLLKYQLLSLRRHVTWLVSWAKLGSIECIVNVELSSKYSNIRHKL